MNHSNFYFVSATSFSSFFLVFPYGICGCWTKRKLIAEEDEGVALLLADNDDEVDEEDDDEEELFEA